MKYFSLLLLMLLLQTSAFAQEPDSKTLEAFKSTPVLHEGRVKPLDTMARALLKDLHGAEVFENKNASEWLWHMTFNPKKVINAPLFEVPNSQAREFLGMPENKKTASALDLADAFEKKNQVLTKLLESEETSMSNTQKDVLSLYNKTLLLTSSLEGRSIVKAETFDPWRIQIELAYNEVKPLTLTLFLYGFSLLLLILTYTIKNKSLNAHLAKSSIALAIAGTLCHIAAISARIYILNRPPVGTLYESVIFVSLICALIGIILSIKRSQKNILIATMTLAAGLLFLAPITSPKGETMDMLAAVLNTNFWLATHVLCISAGYGLCLLAGCLANIALVTTKDQISKLVYTLSHFALLLTAIGTILGGIWADQSWGRFWGWDPKENGALLIVLWLIWLQHAKISNKISNRTFLAGMGFLNVIVSLAWFGVNLLATGLHSYGFTSGMATGLGIFCTLQTLLIAILWRYKTAKKYV